MALSKNEITDVKRAHRKSQTHNDRDSVASAANTLGKHLESEIFKSSEGRIKGGKYKTAGKGIEAAIIWAYNHKRDTLQRMPTHHDVDRALKPYASQTNPIPFEGSDYTVWVEDGKLIQEPKEGSRGVNLATSLPGKLTNLRKKSLIE
ncbi:MAG: hypothetical protein RPU41_03210 [Candidatus Sedimenticola sp. (ex Thyasira tokunagai)]